MSGLSVFRDPHIEIFPSTAGGRQRALFGYHIPYLPDFLTDHTLLGETNSERVAEVLSRWTQFIAGLHKWQDSAFALRFFAHPREGAIELALLARLESETRHTAQACAELANDLAAQLITFGLSYEPLQESGLRRSLIPFDAPSKIIEVRQHEEVTSFLILSKDAYVVHPFWAPAGSWLVPFETMLRQRTKVAVSMYLEPTELEYHEREGLLDAARIAQTLSDQSLQVYSGDAGRLRDPQAELVARVYATILNRLTEPFLLTMQVVSPDLAAAWTVARAFGAAITLGRESSAVTVDEQELPSGFDIRTPQNERDAGLARRCFARLDFSPWGTEMASPGKDRLVYLVGAKGAATAFRLPISVRGGVPGISVRQTPPDFEPGPRPITIGDDELHLGMFRRGGAATVRLHDLNRHTLITGFTGAGKTNTVLYLLNQLWAERHRRELHQIPFLVIEAAKKEYRGLIDQPGYKDLLVFTLGDETTSPFRLNPFELLPGVRLEAHLGRLQTCFDAALPQFGILPSIMAESLEKIYADKGWRLTDKGEQVSSRIFPTLRDLYTKVIQVAESRGYAGETYHNIRAAAAGRIGSLLQGSKGRMFDCQRSISVELLMNRPVVLELNDLNRQDKSLVMMFLLVLLREYRELHKGKKLQHVTVVEEAHNVMENVTSVGASEVAADTRAKAVEAFAAMLAEVRAYGEGMIISDQSPEKLAPDALRNTNLQIAHQLRHRSDREAISAAMIMDDAQEAYLGKLRVGEAAIFLSGYDRATFIHVPPFKDKVSFEEPPDERVANHMMAFKTDHSGTFLPFDGCRFCLRQCKYRDHITPVAYEPQSDQRFRRALWLFEQRRLEGDEAAGWEELVNVCRTVVQDAGLVTDDHAAYCCFTHLWGHRFTAAMADRFRSTATGK